MPTNKNTNNLTFPVIKYFEHQGPKIVRVLREMTVVMFENIFIDSWIIYQRWMLFEKFMKGPSLTKFRNNVLYCRDVVREESGYQ